MSIGSILLEKLLSRDGVQEFWVDTNNYAHDKESMFGFENHCRVNETLPRLDHVIDAAHVAKLEAALKVAVDGLVSVKKEWVSAQYETGYQTQKMIASVTLAEIERIAGGE